MEDDIAQLITLGVEEDTIIFYNGQKLEGLEALAAKEALGQLHAVFTNGNAIPVKGQKSPYTGD